MLDVLRQACSAVSHVHSLGIVHRDIRLDNFLVTATHHDTGLVSIVLADFGLAHQLSSLDPTAVEALPERELPKGPRTHIAPEVVKDAGFGQPKTVRVSYAADVYILGGFMFEVLSGGKQPWHWASTTVVDKGVGCAQAQDKHLLDCPQAMASVEVADEGKPPVVTELVELMRQCLDRKPANRPTMQAIVRALEELENTFL